ncbi:hypothetical protein F8M41_009248 [Gigaspora margarita]|uniref:Uncharacterized protein n=1 Tax=Gigaspora margarita TaxID=4874 RepID=A0A8H3X2C2_GIGMA|nr:hypothetical protein F8M41_009248 [Gigaspora margarita]
MQNALEVQCVNVVHYVILNVLLLIQVKKRGPKTDNEYSVQVYVPNGSENGFDGISILSSATPKPVQGHASTLSGCLQQQPVNVDDVIFYSDFSDLEQVYILNNFENGIDGTSMPYSMTLNPVQGHASILSLSEYPQQQSDNVVMLLFILNPMKKQSPMLFKMLDPFLIKHNRHRIHYANQ